MVNEFVVYGRHGGVVVVAAASQQEGHKLDPWALGLSESFVPLGSAWVSSGCSSFLPQSRNVNVRQNGNWKLRMVDSNFTKLEWQP